MVIVRFRPDDPESKVNALKGQVGNTVALLVAPPRGGKPRTLDGLVIQGVTSTWVKWREWDRPRIAKVPIPLARIAGYIPGGVPHGVTD